MKTMDSNEELLESIKKNDLENVKRWVEKGANLHADDDYALRFSAGNGYLEIVKYLLEQGANLHLQREDEDALQMAAENGHLEIVKYLLEQGANLHAADNGALRWTARNGHLEVVKHLLEQGADFDILSEQKLVKLFISYDLQIKKITPQLSSLLLKINLVKKPCQASTRNKILSTYRGKLASSLIILMYHLYYRPSGPGFFQAIEEN